MSDYEEFKDKEFIGDKLLNVIISERLLKEKVSRCDLNRVLSKMTSTKNMVLKGKKNNIKPNVRDISFDYRDKKIANQIEFLVYEKWKNQGYEAACNFVFKIFFK